MAQQQQQQMQLHQPKLELSLAHLESDKPKQPLPQGLGGQAWRPQLKPAGSGRPTVAFVVTTSDSLQQIRIWISYHKSIGVSNFYIFADGQVHTCLLYLPTERRLLTYHRHPASCRQHALTTLQHCGLCQALQSCCVMLSCGGDMRTAGFGRSPGCRLSSTSLAITSCLYCRA
jgi:hypothetical protein